MQPLITEALNEFWQSSVKSIETITAKEERSCYRVQTDGDCLFVKLIQTECGLSRDIISGLHIQQYIARHGLCTSEIVPSVDGMSYAQLDSHCITVERWISLQTPSFDLQDWHDLGQLCGKLHSIPITQEVSNILSRLDPVQSLSIAFEQISRLCTTAPESYKERIDKYLTRAKQLDPFPPIPRVLVHSDITWDNVLRNLDGSLVLIDLEGAGLAPAVMDLAEVTTKLCLGPSASGPLEEGAASSFYDGYREYRSLSMDEIEAFSDAHFFHQFYYLSDSLRRSDFGFIDRMETRLTNWDNGIINTLKQIVLN